MIRSRPELGEASNIVINCRVLVCTIVALFIGSLVFASVGQAQSAFPKDAWATELIEPELADYWGEKKTPMDVERGPADRFSARRNYIPLPARNPRQKAMPAMAQKIPAEPPPETLITTGAIEKTIPPAPVELPKSKLARNYCLALKSGAENARLEWQRRDLEKVKTLVQQQTNELKKKISELEMWFGRRQAIAMDYEKQLMHIYKQMQPDNAANQLGSMKVSIAKRILLMLGPGNASAILDEMDPTKAAALTSLIATEARSLAMQSKAAKKIAGNVQ